MIHLLRLFSRALSISLVASAAAAQNAVIFSPDITANLGTLTPTLVEDDDIARDNGAGVVAIPSYLASITSSIPASAEVAGFELASVGPLLVLDTTAALPGLPSTLPAEPRDVVRFDAGTGNFSMYFDGSANGIPPGVAIDSIATDPTNQLLLSFDTTVALPGGVTADDEDVVRFASGTYTMEFDGSAHGVDSSLDLDAATRVKGSNQLLISFDGSGSVPGAAFDDEDAIAYETVAATYAPYFDGSSSDPVNWPAADLAALPEPGRAVSLAFGALTLATLLRARRARVLPARVGWFAAVDFAYSALPDLRADPGGLAVSRGRGRCGGPLRGQLT